MEEWIKLQFSKEFLEKVKTYEDYNFMGKYLFEKAELTYTYVNTIIGIFENSGMHIHCVPLIVFQRFFTKEILNNNFLSSLFDIKFARLLHKLNYHADADAIF